MIIHPDVVALARAREPERYIAATLSPVARRAALLAVAAFAADLRRIPHVVTEPMMGEMRLQWWRETITAFGRAESIGHPIADALAAAVRAYDLPPLSLIAMTEARAFDLYDDPMPDEAAFDGYLTKTEAIAFDLAHIILGGPAAPDMSMLAARSFGQARLLAELPMALAKGRVPLPLSRLETYGIDVDALRAGHAVPGLRDLLRSACDDVEAARSALSRRLAACAPSARAAFLPAATVASYVSAILDPGRDATRMPAEISPLTRVMRIGRAHWLGL